MIITDAVQQYVYMLKFNRCNSNIYSFTIQEVTISLNKAKKNAAYNF